MLSLLQSLKTLLHKVCQPDPSIYPPNSPISKLQHNRNKLSFFIHFAIFMIPLFTLPYSKFSPFFNLIRIGNLILTFIIFMITCRSYLLLGQILNAIITNLAAFYMICQPEGTYFQLSLANVAPIFLFMVTQNPYISAASAIFQTILLKIKFKPNLLQTIVFTDPEFFVEKFVSGFVVAYIGMQTIYMVVFLTLNKRTLELSKATKAAEDALEQQKTFLYSFSHEMRNPMNSLLGNIDLVLMNNLAPETRNMLNTAKTCGVLLLNLINTVLDAGKISLGGLEVKPAPTRVHDVFQRTWMISHDLIAQKGLKSHLKIEKKVPPLLLLDNHRLGQILLNLIGNAIKFTQRGSIHVTVKWLRNSSLPDKWFEPRPYDEEDEGIFEKEENMSCYQMNSFDREDLDYFILNKKDKEFDLQGILNPEQESTGVLKIIVQDTGCGIAQDEVPKLFNKFSQVGKDTSQRSMGTGLGLYISKEICKNMNGDIRVFSKPNKGTTFIVCIPTTALPINRQSHLANNPDGVIEALRVKKLKVIVADDSPFNVNLVSNFCEKFGGQVLAATNDGLNAYKKYVAMVKSGVNIDVVTLDIDMPIMDGKEACEKIRQYEKENNVKPAIIMLISGNYEMQQVSELIGDRQKRKADSFIRKPLVLSEFCWNLYKHVYN